MSDFIHRAVPEVQSTKVLNAAPAPISATTTTDGAIAALKAEIAKLEASLVPAPVEPAPVAIAVAAPAVVPLPPVAQPLAPVVPVAAAPVVQAPSAPPATAPVPETDKEKALAAFDIFVAYVRTNLLKLVLAAGMIGTITFAVVDQARPAVAQVLTSQTLTDNN